MNLSLFSKKSELLILTFLNLIVQTIITRIAMLKTSQKQKNNKWFHLGLFIVQIMLIYTMLMPLPVLFKFLLFCIFSVTWGYSLATLNLNDTVVHVAFYGTLGIFGIAALLGTLLTAFNVNLGPSVGIGLFYGLLSLLLFGIFNLITGNGLYKLASMFGVILFSMYILYHTNRIMQRDYKDDFIQASLDYYLDILNIFVNSSH